MQVKRIAGWVAAVGAIELVARTLAYAFSPDPRAEAFGQVTGGPRPVAIAVAALALAALVSGAVLFVSALAVRERHRLRRGTAPAPLRFGRLALRASALLVANSAIFTAIESSIHWHDGLGFHGMHCLFGPVHRDALPLIAALALVTAAIVEAVGHAIEFGRRIVAAEGARRRIPRAVRPLPLTRPGAPLRARPAVAVRGDRGPPAISYR